MIPVLFYIAAAVALFSTGMALTRANAIHTLIYLIISLLGVAVLFFLLGAPFAAALEIVVYAGAIMVLFIFVIMMLNLGSAGDRREMQLLKPSVWIVPVILIGILLVDFLSVALSTDAVTSAKSVTAKRVGIELFGPWMLAVELASMLLLAGLVGSYHLGKDYLRRNRGRGR